MGAYCEGRTVFDEHSADAAETPLLCHEGG